MNSVHCPSSKKFRWIFFGKTAKLTVWRNASTVPWAEEPLLLELLQASPKKSHSGDQNTCKYPDSGSPQSQFNESTSCWAKLGQAAPIFLGWPIIMFLGVYDTTHHFVITRTKMSRICPVHINISAHRSRPLHQKLISYPWKKYIAILTISR